MKESQWRLICLALIAFVCLVIPLAVCAQEPATNTAHISYTDATGKTLTVPVSGVVEIVLNHVAAAVILFIGISASFAGKLLLRFLPGAADPNSIYSKLIAALKVISVTTPEKHVDVKVVEDKLIASPTNNLTATPGVGASATKIAGAAVLAFLFLIGSVVAQETPAASPIAPTNTVTQTIAEAAQGLINAVKAGTTNWWFEAHGLYADKLTQHVGGGAGVFWPVGDFVYGGVRLDYVDGGFYMPSGSVGLKLPLHLTKWLTITPLTYGGIGIPISGTEIAGFTVPGNNKVEDGDAVAIIGYGAALHLFTTADKSWSASLVGDREKWTGFDGYQYRVALAINHKF